MEVDEIQPLVQDTTPVETQIVQKGLTIATCAVFIVGEMAGSGVLALPDAIKNAGWIGLCLLPLCAFFSAYTGEILGKAWSITRERYPERFQGHVRYPYPALGQITYGKPGRYLVSISIDFTLFGVSVVFLILASQNLQALLADVHGNLSFCYWLIIMTAALVPLTFPGTPKDFWPIAVGATIATTIACIILTTNITLDHYQIERQVVHTSPSFISFFTAFGTICFAFGGHPAYPTFQTDMKNHRDFGKAVFLAYFIVLMMYIPVSISGYFVYGDLVSDNILKIVSRGPMLYIVQILITLHVIFSFVIVINPLCQEIEEIFKVPKHFTPWRVLSRTVVLLVVLFTAASVPHFGGVLALVGGSTTTLLAYVLPSLFYLKLCRMEGDWPKIEVPLHTKVLNYEILFVGLVAGVASTYSAISGLAGGNAFTVPCYINVTQANGS